MWFMRDRIIMNIRKKIIENRLLRTIVLSIILLLFLYATIVLNLYKITKEFSFNIFESPALGKLFLLFAILIPVVALIHYMFRKKDAGTDPD